MKKKIIITFFILGLLSVSFLLSDSSDLIIGSSGCIGSLDPAEPWDSSSSFYITSIFETLVNLNPESMEVVPSLATSWNLDETGKIWKFKLRRGVFFHDGTPFNADAVVFTFNRLLNKKFKYRFYEFTLFDEIFFSLKSVRKIDDYTVEFVLKEPFAPFLYALSVDCVSIISPSAVKKYLVDFRKHPVGTGPFTLGSWKRKHRIELRVNSEYWGRKPGFLRIVTYIKNDFNMLLKLFMNKKIDILLRYSISKISALKGLSWVGRAQSRDLSINYIAFNLKSSYLKNLKFRKALNYLWNPKILKLVYQDYVQPIHSIIPYGVPGFTDKYYFPFSIEKAKELLKGIITNKRITLKFVILEGLGLNLQTVALFAKNLKRVGIDLKIERVKTEKELERRTINGDFDMSYSGWIADYPDTDSMIRPLFSKTLQEKGMPNLSSWKNIFVRKLIEKARKEKNFRERVKLYKKINNIIMENALCIPLYQGKTVIIYNKRIGELKTFPFELINFFDLKKK